MIAPFPIARDNRAETATDLVMLPQLANRHGLITGATGTGKTVTLHGRCERRLDRYFPARENFSEI
jgi:Cdc6-like AAA superfamily ATPase